jgi:hypothetical protein
VGSGGGGGRGDAEKREREEEEETSADVAEDIGLTQGTGWTGSGLEYKLNPSS